MNTTTLMVFNIAQLSLNDTPDRTFCAKILAEHLVTESASIMNHIENGMELKEF